MHIFAYVGRDVGKCGHTIDKLHLGWVFTNPTYFISINIFHCTSGALYKELIKDIAIMSATSNEGAQ
jgi:hypothetical protein